MGFLINIGNGSGFCFCVFLVMLYYKFNKIINYINFEIVFGLKLFNVNYVVNLWCFLVYKKKKIKMFFDLIVN